MTIYCRREDGTAYPAPPGVYPKEDNAVRKTHLFMGRVFISTVFLGIDHSFTRIGPPVLWETMIFGGRLDEEQWRYTSEAEAIRGHRRVVLAARFSWCVRAFRWLRGLR